MSAQPKQVPTAPSREVHLVLPPRAATKESEQPSIFHEESSLVVGPLSKVPLSRDDAEKYISTLTVDGVAGWRLPTVAELCELMGHPCLGDFKSPTPVRLGRGGSAWTATRVFGRRKNPYYARHFYVLGLRNGYRHNGYGVDHYVLPVRTLNVSVDEWLTTLKPDREPHDYRKDPRKFLFDEGPSRRKSSGKFRCNESRSAFKANAESALEAH